ncbi:UFO kinase, partial [Daphoenositta chrysoptera]|nr:UFO kinase [Daphoenositta chrysoptera]
FLGIFWGFRVFLGISGFPAVPSCPQLSPCSGLRFLEHPSNASAAPGGSLRLRCRVGGDGPGAPPELGWDRDGAAIDGDSDLAQVALPGGGWVATSQLRLSALSVSDSGRYRCWARLGGGER